MTDWNDDELRRALNDEVPAPGGDYWDAIDARLNQVAAERSGEHSDVVHLDQSANSTDTGDDVIRLTDMTTYETPSRSISGSRLAFAAAAAAIVIAGIVGVFALRDTPSAVDIADTPDATEAPQDDAAPEPSESNTEDADATPVALATEVPIVIADGFTVLSPVAPVDIPDDIPETPDFSGTLCPNGREARTPDLLPPPIEQATASDPTTGGTVVYTRFQLESDAAVASVLEKWAPDGCEATIASDVDDAGVETFADEPTFVFDSPIEVSLPDGYTGTAAQVDTDSGDVGVLVLTGGTEIVLVVVPDLSSDDIPAVLQTAADAYDASLSTGEAEPVDTEPESGIERRCYEVETDFTPGEPSQWLIEFNGELFESYQTTPRVDGADGIFARGAVGTDGTAQDIVSTMLPSGLSTDSDWFFTEDSVSDFADSLPYYQTECDRIAVDVDDLAAELDAAREQVDTILQERNIIGGEPGVVAVNAGITGERTWLTALPGDADGAPGAFQIGAQLNNVNATGRTAFYEGTEYAELRIPVFGGTSGRRGWIALDTLTQSMSIAEIVAAGSGSAMGIIEQVLQPDETGLYALVIEGQTLYISETVDLDEPGLSVQELIEQGGLGPSLTAEFTLSPEFEAFGTITSLRAG